jgi:hypothetical protein
VQIDWPEYQRVHSDRRNLITHIVAVPLFIGAFVFLIVSCFRDDYATVVLSVALAVIAMILRGRGHAKEHEAPIPFSGPVNFPGRWFREQFFIFPVFVLSGRWWQQYRTTGSEHPHET